jgi:hypothetical protein
VDLLGGVVEPMLHQLLGRSSCSALWLWLLGRRVCSTCVQGERGRDEQYLADSAGSQRVERALQAPSPQWAKLPDTYSCC